MAGLKRSIKRKLRAQMEKEFGESVDLACKVAGVALDLSPLKRKET